MPMIATATERLEDIMNAVYSALSLMHGPWIPSQKSTGTAFGCEALFKKSDQRRERALGSLHKRHMTKARQ